MANDDKTYLTTIAIICSFVITICAVALRVLARRVCKIKLGPDDYWFFAGALFTIGQCIAYIFANLNGNGKHRNEIQRDELERYFLSLYISYQFYGLATSAIKLSFLEFFKRCFSTKQFRVRANITSIFIVMWLLANNLTSLFQCRPIRAAWQKEVPGHCLNYVAFFTGTQAPNLLLDIVVLALPVSAVSRLHMSNTKKISIAGIFLLGGLSIIIGIVRLVVLIQQDFRDITYSTGKCSWSVLEPALEVLSACLPTLAPVLHLRPQLGASLRSPIQWQPRSHTSEPSDKNRYSSSTSNQSTMFEGPNSRVEANISAGPSRPFDFDVLPLRSIAVTHDVKWQEEKFEHK